MKSQRDWCGVIGWLLAASLVALQARFVHASEIPSGPSVSINRGETYVIKGLSPDSAPEVTPINNSHALIINKEPDGTILVLGAEAGSETVKIKTVDGKLETYTVTVKSNADPNNPLAPGSAPAAIGDSGSASVKPATTPLDAGAGPAAAPDSSTGASAPKSEAAAGGTPATTPPNSGGAPAGSQPADTTAPAAAPVTSGNDAPQAPLGVSTANNPVAPSQAASQNAVDKFKTDPPAQEAIPDTSELATSGTHYLPHDAIAMMFGTSRVFDFPQRIRRVSIADSDVADLQVINPHQLMLIGHKPGFTTLAVWDDQGRYEERQVRIEQTGHQQVLLNCTVAEVDRSRLESSGVNYSGSLFNSGVSAVGLPGGVATPYTAASQLSSAGQNGSTSGGILPFGGQLIPLLLSTNLTYGLATDNGNFQTNTFFQFIEAHGLGKILAEPHLLANSGQEAKFLEGGEIPIVVAQALNTSVVFKQFGTTVDFIPTVIGRNEIELVVKPEVSKPDPSQGVQLFGFTVPAFITRRAETVVRVKNNQTLIIAGLILTERQALVQKVPYLGDIPWAGALFKTTSYNNDKTELVMSVTPQIVGALPPGAQIDYPDNGYMTREDIRTERIPEPDAARPRF